LITLESILKVLNNYVSRFAPSEKTEPLRDAPSFNLNFDNPQTSDIEVFYSQTK
jgi:hypothetical protein